jgi:ribosomal protein L37E
MSKIYMERCPKCGRENYAMCVSSGNCAWCGYKATEKDINGKTVWTSDKVLKDK